MLTCGIYVDLNPIRAGVAETPEESQFTSAHDRIKALVSEPIAIAAADSAVCSEAATVAIVPESVKPPETPTADAWLCEFTLDESHAESPVAAVKQKNDVINVNESVSPQAIDSSKVAFAPRASERVFLPMSLTKYLKLLDWTGRELRKDKRGAIPRDLAPILERLASRERLGRADGGALEPGAEPQEPGVWECCAKWCRKSTGLPLNVAEKGRGALISLDKEFF